MSARAARRLFGAKIVTVGCCAAIVAAFTGCGGPADTAGTPVAQVRDDAEEAASAPLPAGAERPKAAPRPSALATDTTAASSSSSIAPGAPSDSEVRAELAEMNRIVGRQGRTRQAGGSSAGLDADGEAQTPVDAPELVSRIITGGNAIARYPYVYGGGHRSFVDTAYDCSGSVSYALAAAGLLDAPLTSGQLADWGEPGPGRWVTIYAHGGHVFMYVAGLRFDTSGRSGPFGSRWQVESRSRKGFEVRHPPGL